jgi:hypothetical protein
MHNDRKMNDMSPPLARIDRRGFLRNTSAAGLLMGALTTATGVAAVSGSAYAQGITDADILNFALNLEYLEAEFYQFAVSGASIEALGVATTGINSGAGNPGPITIKANPKVPFATPAIAQYAAEIAQDELAHVQFLRAGLGGSAVARPAIDLLNSFNALAQAAGLGSAFDPFADENSFLLGAYIFEDVGVTAYRGAAPLLQNKTILSAAAGILGTEAYHASEIRTLLYMRGFAAATQAISSVRAALSGSADDQGVAPAGTANIVPTDANGVVFARTTRQVLNIVYGAQNASAGVFYPLGMNGGAIR